MGRATRAPWRPGDSDGVGDSYTRLLTEATIRFEFQLPPNIWLHDDPAAVNETAPYFHDNSAHTLEELVHHYKQVFEIAPVLSAWTLGGRTSLTAHEEADIVAYLRLL